MYRIFFYAQMLESFKRYTFNFGGQIGTHIRKLMNYFNLKILYSENHSIWIHRLWDITENSNFS